MFRGHLGNGVRLVEHHEIVSKQYASGILRRTLGPCTAGVDQRE
jgi:hypothetical protein